MASDDIVGPAVLNWYVLDKEGLSQCVASQVEVALAAGLYLVMQYHVLPVTGIST